MRRSTDLDTKTLTTCGMPKLHKCKGNLPPCRLAVVVVGSPFHCISRWVDIHLIQLLDQTPSYVQTSNDIALMLNTLEELDDDMFLFAADAKATHPNMSTEEGLMFLTIALDNLNFKACPH